MVAQCVKDRARERKGTKGMKKEMESLRRAKALKAHIANMDKYKEVTGRDCEADFSDWLGIVRTPVNAYPYNGRLMPHPMYWENNIKAEFPSWVVERLSELSNGQDWKEGW